jgi:integrase
LGMATGKITVTALNGLEGWLWCTQCVGFGARRQTKGIFFYCRYRHQGRQVMHSIGRLGSPWTPETARKEAQRLLGVVATGVDPCAPLLGGATFGSEIERFLARKQRTLAPRSYVETVRYISDYAAPLHKFPIAEIDRRAIAVLLGQIETRCGATTRNRMRSALSAFWTYAIAEGLAEQSPVAGTAKADLGASRDRVLTPDELRRLWHALGDNRFSEILRLLLLTAARRSEIGNLVWDEIDLARKLIVLPPARTKNGRGLELPLSSQALAVIERQPRRNTTRFLFSDANGYKGWDQDKIRFDARLGIAPWRIHDLRRTAATGMAELHVLPHIVEAVLNHQSGHKSGVAGIYNRARYADEMRTALQRWGDHVDGIVR